jgi:hypothetical protein
MTDTALTFDHLIPSGGKSGESAAGLSFDHLMPEQPIMLPSLKRKAGQYASALGTVIEDVGAPSLGKPLREFGEGVVNASPSQIQSLGDIVQHPITAAKETISELVPDIGVTMAGAAGGAALGGAFGPVGAAIGGIMGGVAPNVLQEYGVVRDNQRHAGIDDKSRAAGAALLAGGLEYLPEKFLGNSAVKALKGAIPEGASRLGYAGKQALKGAIMEGPATEFPQTVVERAGGGLPIGNEEAKQEYAFATAKGAMGGGLVGGGIGAASQRQPIMPVDQAAEVERPEAAMQPAAQQAETQQAPGVQASQQPAAEPQRPSIMLPPPAPTPDIYVDADGRAYSKDQYQAELNKYQTALNEAFQQADDLERSGNQEAAIALRSQAMGYAQQAAARMKARPRLLPAPPNFTVFSNGQAMPWGAKLEDVEIQAPQEPGVPPAVKGAATRMERKGNLEGAMDARARALGYTQSPVENIDIGLPPQQPEEIAPGLPNYPSTEGYDVRNLVDRPIPAFPLSRPPSRSIRISSPGCATGGIPPHPRSAATS